jgi:hypothetical protein
MSATDPKSASAPDLSEAVPLAQQMHAALALLVKNYKRDLGLSPQEALDKATQAQPGDEDRFRHTPPEKLTWYNLHFLTQRDPETAAQRWDEIKQAARHELRSGHRMARAFHDCSPWERAQFLALRDDLAREWRPRNGIERQLIETMAQAQTAWIFWLNVMHTWLVVGAEESGRGCTTVTGHATPRLTTAEAIDRAGAMAERFHRIFLRTLQALRDLRRYTPAVVVQNAVQVNVNGQPAETQNGKAHTVDERGTPSAASGACQCPADRRSRLGANE